MYNGDSLAVFNCGFDQVINEEGFQIQDAINQEEEPAYLKHHNQDLEPKRMKSECISVTQVDSSAQNEVSNTLSKKKRSLKARSKQNEKISRKQARIENLEASERLYSSLLESRSESMITDS